MAFSCYFDSKPTIEAFCKNVWCLEKEDGIKWSVKEEWLRRTTLYPRITLESAEMKGYCAELELFTLNKSSETCTDSSGRIFRRQHLSQSNVIEISTQELRKMCVSWDRVPTFRFQFNIIPCYQLIKAQDETTEQPVPLRKNEGEVDSVTPRTVQKLDKLAHDMYSLLKNGLFCDVLIVSGQFRIKAHKSILSARSPVFAKMLSSGMKESVENEVTISDIPGPVLQEMVSYMYTGTVTFNETSDVRSLYVASDKYAIDELKEMCSCWLKNVTLNTVLEVLILAETYGDKNLKSEAMKFISRNYSTMKVRETWQSFLKEYPGLTIEILANMIDGAY